MVRKQFIKKRQKNHIMHYILIGRCDRFSTKKISGKFYFITKQKETQRAPIGLKVKQQKLLYWCDAPCIFKFIVTFSG